MTSANKPKESAEYLQTIQSQARLFIIPDSSRISGESRRILNETNLGKRLLEPNELSSICAESQAEPVAILTFQHMMDGLVEHARLRIKKQFPLLFKINGALYTPDRSKACWRDLWHFLRITTYGAAIDDLSFCDQQGYAATMELYRLFNVPVDAMAAALVDMASTYRERLQSAPSATEQQLIGGLGHIHTSLQRARHLSWEMPV
ncbi:hypothetical protein [Cyanobium sp. ATX 6F1]|uniref:hypothetical protein n=1 Tax=unclassified Cyanobium TaxID=2627006 RepID=UPI0020CD431C|nr:hypothetical protein [Cyanobium sp. ATX 6F1]MCP9917206.1 hypothetical protein [Cyanobium sp. ATX 6F1]